MSLIKRLASFLLVFAFLFIPLDGVFAKDMQIATSDVHKRWTKIPGEPFYYDPHTNIEFNPLTGKINNIKEFLKIPGERYYYHKSNKYKAFDPKIYTQYVIKKKNFKSGKPKLEKDKKGWTIYWGVSVEGGIGAWGGSSSGDIALSYNTNTKKFTISVVGGAGVKTAVFGEDFAVGTHLGFSTVNEKGLGGLAVAHSVEVPFAEITVKGSDSIWKKDTVELQLQAGSSIGISGMETSWNESWTVAEFGLW